MGAGGSQARCGGSTTRQPRAHTLTNAVDLVVALHDAHDRPNFCRAASPFAAGLLPRGARDRPEAARLVFIAGRWLPIKNNGIMVAGGGAFYPGAPCERAHNSGGVRALL